MAEQDKDLQLISLIRNGDRSAMSDLYRRHIGYLTALCSRYVADKDETKDILQNCFIKIFSSMDRFQYRGIGSLKAWMSRIVVNESLKHLQKDRKTGRFKEEMLKDSSEIQEEDPDFDDVPASVIQKMIRELPDGYRTVFNLFVLEQKSHKEISEMLGITVSTSASQFHRAKNQLAKQIREYKKRQNR